MGNNHSASGGSGGGNTLKKHIETATKTGVLQYDNKKLKEVRLIRESMLSTGDCLLDRCRLLSSRTAHSLAER